MASKAAKIISAIVLAISAAAGSASAQESVKVGLILPMTGPFTSTGKQINAAVRL
jgi:branched-chain amino acid transport system substrate-binding protein